MATAPTGLIPVDEISSDDEEDTALLRAMAVSARKYIAAHEWCPPIAAMYLADGVGGVVAVFLAEFATKIGGTDNRLWVVNGDLPDAYLIVEPDDSASAALEKYCLLLDGWIREVLVSGDFKDVFPVAAQRTLKNADLFRRRVDFLRRDILPQFQDQPIDL